MATAEEVGLVRSLANYKEVDPYDDTQLSALIDANSVNRVVAQLWQEKAASQAALVNIAESGSSRSMGDAHKNSLALAKYYLGLATAEEVPAVDTSRYARTRAIVREGEG